MRTLFILLLLLNVAFFAWQYYAPPPQPVAIAPLSDKLNPIELLSEQPGASSPTNTQTGAPTTETPPASKGKGRETPATVCQTLGPFRDKQQLAQVRKRLGSAISGASVRTIQERRLHRYWVYLPPQPSRQKAVAQSKKLADAKIKDYYIVLSGENKNSISLGHFRDKGHAEARQKQVQQLGFDSRTQLIYRDFELYWLDFQADQPVSRELYASDDSADDDISVINRACKP